jgi:hypothetical protein
VTSSDAAELAWAAGFFDGEGSTGTALKRADSLGVFASVPQAASTTEHIPAVLLRFHRAIGGLGRVSNPYFDRRSGTYLFQWRTDNFEEIQAVVALLWSHLGPVKRSQASRALMGYVQHHASSRIRQRRPKKPRRLQLEISADPVDSAQLVLAWAAGLFDAEGSTEIHLRRRSGDVFFALRSKVSQCDANGIPEVLLRFQTALSSGWIEGPATGEGYANAYKWAAGASETLVCLNKLWPYLGAVKRAQALAVLGSLDVAIMRRRHVWRDDAKRFVARHSVEETAPLYPTETAV